MDLRSNFIKYCQFNTRSSESSLTAPSTSTQLDFAKNVLVPQLNELGLSDVILTSQGIVYAKLASNDPTINEKIGLVAHMDTADYESEHVNPIVKENYDGLPISLANGRQLDCDQFPWLTHAIGKTIIHTDGTTLLGGDDKAGIAIIMEVLARLANDSSIKHGQISIAFTPDEEVGRGTENFDVQLFDADFAYTVDGGDITYIADETFNASRAVIEIKGRSIHPGSAKNQMVNAADIAVELASYLPKQQRPQYTDGSEGFFHLDHIEANCEHALLTYIIRDYDHLKLKEKKQLLKSIVEMLRIEYGDCIDLKLSDQYRNMKIVLKDHPQVVQRVVDAYENLGVSYQFEKIRGGTDGANLSFMGLPCPNLGTGDYNCHGPYEYVVVDEMETMCDIIVEMIRGN